MCSFLCGRADGAHSAKDMAEVVVIAEQVDAFTEVEKVNKSVLLELFGLWGDGSARTAAFERCVAFELRVGEDEKAEGSDAAGVGPGEGTGWLGRGIGVEAVSGKCGNGKEEEEVEEVKKAKHCGRGRRQCGADRDGPECCWCEKKPSDERRY
jgi:hypothetical protein